MTSADPAKQNRKVPELRFPGFDGEWVGQRLGEMLAFKNGINADKSAYGRGIKFINVLDILNNDFITYEKVIGEVDVSPEMFEKNRVSYGDILFQRSSEVREEAGTANVYLDKEKDCTFGGFVIRGKRIGLYEPFFMKELLKGKTARKEITSWSGGSTRYNIGQDTLAKVLVLLPAIPEQERIAGFLSDIDGKIDKLARRKELLEQYKKGMMQKLFSRELRFKDDDGNDCPDWKEKRLGKVFVERSQKNRGEMELLSVTMDKGVIRRSEIEGKDNSSQDKSNYKQVKRGDIVYNSHAYVAGGKRFVRV